METYKDEASGETISVCPMCDEHMLYWQLQNHIVGKHGNIEKWNYSVGDDFYHTCSQCAQTIIETYNMVQVDWHMWSAKGDGTDVEYDLWKNFRQSLQPFKCATCWERNH